MELLQAVADDIPDVVCLEDVRGRYLPCNEALADFTGQRIEQILGADGEALFGSDEAVLRWSRSTARYSPRPLPQTRQRQGTLRLAPAYFHQRLGSRLLLPGQHKRGAQRADGRCAGVHRAR